MSECVYVFVSVCVCHTEEKKSKTTDIAHTKAKINHKRINGPIDQLITVTVVHKTEMNLQHDYTLLFQALYQDR